MVARVHAVAVLCCLLLQGTLADPCGNYGAGYTCYQGLPGEPGYQLCQSTDSYICPTQGIAAAPYGCGSVQTNCPKGGVSQRYSANGPIGSSTGDPFLQGFDGRSFDFLGKKDQVFNMITHPDHQLNAAFIDAEFPFFVNGTFIGAVGILHRSHQIQAHVLNDGQLDVIADGVALTPDHRMALGDAFVELDAFGTSLTFRSELCFWKIAAVAPYTWQDNFYKAHIDMQLELLKDPTAMHGVLGQTVNSARGVWPEGDLEFHGEGLAEDYKLSDLLSTDFKFNMFGKSGPTPFTLTKARMLLASGVAKTAVTYPSFASISTHPRVNV